MPIINIEVRQKVAISPLTHLVCGNSDYQIAFQFDEEWAEHSTKTARFIWADQYVDVVFQDDICDVPVIINTNYCAVGVFAGNLRTSTPALISCDKSILCSDGSPAEPPADVYAQIMEMLNTDSAKHLTVTVRYDGELDCYVASHTSEEIAAYVRNGGTASLLHDLTTYQNNGGYELAWYFSHAFVEDWSVSSTTVIVYADGTCEIFDSTYRPANPEETDPTVPDWAKQETKPTYTADEVGSLSATNPVGSGTFSMGRKSGTAVGTDSICLGTDVTASANYSHAEGSGTVAKGTYSHAEGLGTIAAGIQSHVQGAYNQEDTSKLDRTTGRKRYAHIVGNGTADTKRSNAHTVDWSGNAWFAGDVTVGGTWVQASTTSYPSGAEKLVKESELAAVTPSIGENGNWFIGGEDTGVSASGGGGSTGGGGGALEKIFDITTTEKVTTYQIPIDSQEVVDKIETAKEIRMYLYVPIDAEDTETTISGKVSIKLNHGSWSSAFVQDVDAIPAPNASWNRYRTTFCVFLTPGFYTDNKDESVGVVRFVAQCGLNLNPTIKTDTAKSLFTGFAVGKSIDIVGSQNMAAGTRFVMEVRV